MLLSTLPSFLRLCSVTSANTGAKNIQIARLTKQLEKLLEELFIQSKHMAVGYRLVGFLPLFGPLFV